LEWLAMNAESRFFSRYIINGPRMPIPGMMANICDNIAIVLSSLVGVYSGELSSPGLRRFSYTIKIFIKIMKNAE
jgi:hypothetical protein